MKQLRGCLFRLALYALVAIALTMIIERRIGQRVPAVVAGLIAGVIATAALGHVGTIISKLRELMLIRAGLAGHDPRDGKRFAAIGTITPSGGTRLTSPLTHTPAISYNYWIVRPGKRSWEGVAMVPSTIRCGLHSIRLLALPELIDLPKDQLSGTAVQRAEDYVRITEFQPFNRDVKKIFDDLYSAYRDGDGTLRQDRGLRVKKPSLSDAVMAEQILRPNDTICAIGVYSSERGGLVADPAAVRHSVTIEKAEPLKLILRRFRAIGGALMNAVLMLAIVAAALAVLYTIVPLDSVERADISWLEIGIEDVVDDRLRTPLVNAGMPMFVQPEPGAWLDAGEARGRIRNGAKEATVTNAIAQWQQRQLAIQFLDGATPAGAITMSPAGELSSLRIFSDDVSQADRQAVRLVVQRISNTEMAGRLSWTRDGIPVCRVIFRVPIPVVEKSE